MIIVLNTDALKKIDVDIIDYLILKIIYASTRNKHSCFISQNKMGEYLGLSRQTLNKRLKVLEEKKYIYKDFQYKRVTKNIEEMFYYESEELALIRSRHREKVKRERKKRLKTNGDVMLKLFNEVYSKIKRGELE